ncbi:MAG: serine hydrolase [Planctomycetota bacterium]|jgi:beta-lactamase class A|nr:MAG: serine hydrolase [Planctomycetota bacterium]
MDTLSPSFAVKSKPWAYPLACFFIISTAAFSLAQPPSLSDKIAPLTKAHEGKVAIAVKNLTSGETYYHQAGLVMPTASLIKLGVMTAAYRLSDQSEIRLNDMVLLQKEDKVPGSGILTSNFSEGASFPLKDAIRLMIAYSDNTATNLVLDHIGIRTVNTTLTQMGFPNTRINAKVFKGSTTSIAPEQTKKYGLGSTTAKETIDLLELIYTNKAATEKSCTAMIEHLKKCEDKDMIPRELTGKLKSIAHKIGAVSDARTDAGIMYFDGGPVVICVLTAENKDKRWTSENSAEILIGKIGLTVFDHFKTKK